MKLDGTLACNYVVKALDIPALRFLDETCPAPQKIEWINRANDRRLRESTISQLNRTLQMPNVSPSVRQLHHTSGIRTCFGREQERNLFARCFARAQEKHTEFQTHFVTANFTTLDAAKSATAYLLDCGVAAQDIHLIQSCDMLDVSRLELPDGHGKLELVGTLTVGGLLGMAIGLAAVCMPAIGLAGGLLAAQTATIAPTVGGLLGVTGSAMTKMVSDHDVDGNALSYYAKKILRGAILLSVDLRDSNRLRPGVEQLLIACGGTIQRR
jgi:hypothetical protein